MHILLVEDDDNKRSQLEAFLNESASSISVDTARSLQSGLRALLSQEYDLVLLDMTLPTFDIGIDEDGGRPQAYAGRELLRQMERHSITTPAVVVTQFDRFGEDTDALTLLQLDDQLRSSHPINYWGCVYYDAGISEWREALAEIVTHIRNSTGA